MLKLASHVHQFRLDGELVWHLDLRLVYLSLEVAGSVLIQIALNNYGGQQACGGLEILGLLAIELSAAGEVALIAQLPLKILI